MTTAIETLWRAPFTNGPVNRREFHPSLTVAEMVEGMDFLPPDFAQRGRVVIVGHRHEIELDRSQWHRIRLKPGQRLHCAYALSGGGGGEGGGRKAVLGVVLAVATILTAGAASAGLFGTLTGIAALGPGMLGAKLLGIAITPTGTSLEEALSKIEFVSLP